MEEIEVFRMNPSISDKDKCYEFAFYTRKEGYWPNERYYTTFIPKYVGKFVKSERCGYGDGGGGAEIFDDNGIFYRSYLNFGFKIGYRFSCK